MTKQLLNTSQQIKLLEAEDLTLTTKPAHKGFRDASRRNRIEEQLQVLHQTLRRAALNDIEDRPAHDAEETK